MLLEKTLESPLDRRSNQSVLKENNPRYSLEALMLKLKLQYFLLPDVKTQLTGKSDAEAPILGHLMQRVNSLEKTLMLGKIDGRRRRG